MSVSTAAIKHIIAERKTFEERINDLQCEIDQSEDQLAELVLKHYKEEHCPANALTPRSDLHADDLNTEESWKCEGGSPTDYCVYDLSSDLNADSCLYCNADVIGESNK